MRLILAALLLCLAGHCVAQTISPPRCMIDQFAGNFHTATSAAGDPVAVLWCDDQEGLTYWGIGGNQVNALANLSCINVAGPVSWSLAWVKAAWAACISVAPNADQMHMIGVLATMWNPHISVQGPANQNVYTLSADGSRGPQLVVAGVGMQVAPGVNCNGGRIANAGARYHDVSGATSTNGVVLQTGSFALCQITYAPAAGWPIT